MRIKFEDKVFAYRIAGIAMHEDKVLIHKAEFDNFWALPGGACEFNEDSKTALKREMKEELNADIEVGPLLWLVENFFEHEGKPWHEIGLYYHFNFIGPSEQFYLKNEFDGIESLYNKENKNYKLLYKWLPLSQIHSHNIKPDFLLQGLSNLPKQTTVILNRK